MASFLFCWSRGVLAHPRYLRSEAASISTKDGTHSGIATQKPGLRARLIVEKSAERLKNYLEATTELMKVLARACGHTHIDQFTTDDLTTWKRDIAYLTGVSYAGLVPLSGAGAE